MVLRQTKGFEVLRLQSLFLMMELVFFRIVEDTSYDNHSVPSQHPGEDFCILRCHEATNKNGNEQTNKRKHGIGTVRLFLNEDIPFIHRRNFHLCPFFFVMKESIDTDELDTTEDDAAEAQGRKGRFWVEPHFCQKGNCQKNEKQDSHGI